MSGILPKSAKLQLQVAAYLRDSGAILTTSIKAAESSIAFPEIYRISLATDTILANLASGRFTPSLSPARGIALRVPLLVAIGQSTAAKTELRRFLELVSWTIYFSDHPVEWQSFSKAADGYSREPNRPISHAAHRELAWFLAYARELMESEPSGLATKAIGSLDQMRQKLNAAVHAGHVAKLKGRLAPQDEMSEPELMRFQRLQRQAFSNSCLLLAAYRKDRFNSLKAMTRAYFDWLVGAPMRKQVRSAPFGLPDSSTD